MTVSELVARLIAAGTPPDVAACVVAEAFAEGVSSVDVRRHSADETAERRRAKDRDRKRLLRGNPQTSADIPRKSADTPLTLSSSPQEQISIKEGKKVRARKRAASELSADWQPSESHFTAAASLNISRDGVLNKAEDMRLWAKSTGAMKVDWEATFHGFLRRDAQKIPVRAPRTPRVRRGRNTQRRWRRGCSITTRLRT
jgi:hypothetical protein